LIELCDNALKREVILAFEERYRYVGCQVCKVRHVELFVKGAATDVFEKFRSVRFTSGARLCNEHKMITATNNFFIAEKEWPEKARLIAVI
jgi:hypothetical protein